MQNPLTNTQSMGKTIPWNIKEIVEPLLKDYAEYATFTIDDTSYYYIKDVDKNSNFFFKILRKVPPNIRYSGVPELIIERSPQSSEKLESIVELHRLGSLNNLLREWGDLIRKYNKKAPGIHRSSMPQTKKLKYIDELLYEARSWHEYNGYVIQGFMHKASKMIKKIDGPDSKFAEDIYIFSKKENDFLSSGIIVTDWKERIINVLQLLKFEIENSRENEVEISPVGNNYVNQRRIAQLSKIKSPNYDCSKLIQLCYELNSSYRNHSYYAVGAIVRSIIDHIPPIFGCTDFNGVANKYCSVGNAKSFKASMLHLNNSMKKISDSYLHSQIRNKEVLPNETQIDCKRDLDILLGEVVRLLG